VTSNSRARKDDDLFDDRVNLEDRRELREQSGRRKERVNHESSEISKPVSNSTDGANQLARYGPLQAFLDDPTIEEIWINSPQRVFIARNGKSELTNLILTSDEIQALMDRILLWSGRRIDLSQPFVDARLPDGSRLHIAIPEITSEHWAINIRKHLMRGKSLKDLVELEVMNEDVAQILRAK
jgi:Flp pilus assembly CpaF family ATPase